jgi:serine/threonine protein kinase
MDANQHQRVMQILGEVIEKEPGQRDTWLADACVGDEPLRGEVGRLLAHQKSAPDFLEESPFAVAMQIDSEPEPVARNRIGTYKIIQELGRGGMGVVYLVERDDQEFAKHAAAKVIKPGMDTDFVLQRFRNERQILASLDHQNIARLLDGGTTSEGLPYFIMEYVEGRPITEYANAKDLTIVERLRLFRTVCSAVNYAHQQLVVHRDIKPSNILVTEAGEPKLVDFGIAKLLQTSSAEDADLTATVVRVMTTEYASPEQIKGERITTSTDVYSLGVLLYELLTGHRPYRPNSRNGEEIAKVICEQQPSRPSDAAMRQHGEAATAEDGTNRESAIHNSKSLRGDLDNIVLKALRKEPQRRYVSIDQFSEDIRRHLEGLPVIACKATLSYRASKFVQRNKIGVAAAAIILLTLIGGIITTAWQAHKTRVQSARAEQRFNQARALAHSVVFDYHDAIASLPGSTPVRERLVKDALKYLDELGDDEDNGPSLQRELAAAYLKVGDVQSQLNRANLGDTNGALDSYRKSLAIREALFASDPKDVTTRLDLSVSYGRMGDVLSKSSNTPAALESYRKSLHLVEDVVRNDPQNVEARRDLAYDHLMVARALLKTGELSAALESFHTSRQIREAMLAENPNDASLYRALIPSFDGIAYVLSLYGKMAEALDYYRKSQTISESLVAANPTNAEFRRVMMDTYEWVGITFGELGDNAEGLKYHQEALALCLAQLASDPMNAQARDDLGDVYQEIGNTLTRLGKSEAALDNYRRSLENYQAISDADPNDANARRQVYATYRQMGNALALGGNPRGALESYRKALAVFQELSRIDPTNVETQYDVALSYRKIGEALTTIGDAAGALDDYRKALPIFEGLVTRSPANAKKRADLALTYYDLGLGQLKLASADRGLREHSSDHWREARDYYQKSLNIWQEMKNQGTLSGAYAGKPDELARVIARCNAALAGNPVIGG